MRYFEIDWKKGDESMSGNMEISYQKKTYQIEGDTYKVKDGDQSYTLTEAEYEIFSKNADKQESKNSEKVGELVSFYNDMIQFNPFQYKPYLRLISKENKKKCIYIADEVGAGKTFETGIIISELLYSNRVALTDSMLIICPNMLCRKWQEILSNFFGLASRIVKDLESIHNISIMSYDSISRIKEDATIPDIKLLIVDEAHNASGAKRFNNMIKIRNRSEYTVLLSATPLAGKDENEENQIKLLFGEEKSEFNFDKEGSYLNRSLKDEMRDGFVTCTIKNISIKNTLVIDYIDICKAIFAKRNTLRKYTGLNMIMSSPAAAKEYCEYLAKLDSNHLKKLLISSQMDQATLEEYGVESLDELYDLMEMEDDDLSIIDDDTVNNIREEIKGLGSRCDAVGDDKLEKLKLLIEENIKKFQEQEKGAEFYKKIVVFTNYNSTAQYLKENIGENSIVINGTIDESEKWKRFNEFKDFESDKNILIITNVACEGQDMDFCNTIVNYDLTYNPVQLAQRKGRVDRFEVKKAEIFIYNFIVEGIDPSNNQIQDYVNDPQNSVLNNPNSMYPVLLRKLQTIKKETGVYYNVIDHVGISNNIIDKEKAQRKVVSLFENYFSNEKIADLTSIERLYKEYYGKKYDKINNLLKLKDIIMQKSQDQVTVTVEKNNKDFLKYVYDGGTLNSHLIYNK